MWPFRKKISADEYKLKGQSFELTQEEQQAVARAFEMFEGVAVLKEYADAVQRMTAARALVEYAQEKILDSERELQTTVRSKLIEKALVACFKACNIYPLPIFDYDLACLMEMAGKPHESKGMFEKFLTWQITFKPTQIDEAYLKQRDVEQAIVEARQKLAVLR